MRTSVGWTLSSAGYSLVGMIEEGTEADVRALFETNYFGMLRLIQAALPLLRKQGNGHIVGVSTGTGITAIPLKSLYCATKWAVEPRWTSENRPYIVTSKPAIANGAQTEPV
jgi:NADP-dependent 3-hydroxy acid dehydrogenase YdfG